MDERIEQLRKAQEASAAQSFNGSGRLALIRALRKLSEQGISPEHGSSTIKLVKDGFRRLETSPQ